MGGSKQAGDVRRSPHGERGLKFEGGGKLGDFPLSLPHGERGLKYVQRFTEQGQFWSLPPRGAWIEIVCICRLSVFAMSLPPTGSVD